MDVRHEMTTGLQNIEIRVMGSGFRVLLLIDPSSVGSPLRLHSCYIGFMDTCTVLRVYIVKDLRG